jgi:alpha-tubulin suppressor-like RCC1 family protein
MSFHHSSSDSVRRCSPYAYLTATALLIGALGCQDAESPTEPAVTSPEATPQFATTAPLAFHQTSGGSNHTCGVTTDNRAYCWGDNFWGQLGDGTTEDHSRPVAVAGGLRFKMVSAGQSHSCGVGTDSRVYCWGNGDEGRLGNGTTFRQSTPVRVAGAREYLQVEAGGVHTCAINSTDRRAFCWGFNTSGQLGNGTTSSSLRPAAVSGGRAFREIDTGSEHTCGVTTTNIVFCWGVDRDGQIGDGATRANRSVPTRIAIGRRFDQVDAGPNHNCAVTTDHRVFCWGDNRLGQIGDGTTLDRYEPRAVKSGISFSRVSAGVFHTCGETTVNKVYCWGSNSLGTFGNGTTAGSRTPTLGGGGNHYTQVSSGAFHTCGISPSDLAFCWGDNVQGQLGDGNSGSGAKSTTPVPVVEP